MVPSETPLDLLLVTYITHIWNQELSGTSRKIILCSDNGLDDLKKLFFYKNKKKIFFHFSQKWVYGTISKQEIYSKIAR